MIADRGGLAATRVQAVSESAQNYKLRLEKRLRELKGKCSQLNALYFAILPITTPLNKVHESSFVVSLVPYVDGLPSRSGSLYRNLSQHFESAPLEVGRFYHN